MTVFWGFDWTFRQQLHWANEQQSLCDVNVSDAVRGMKMRQFKDQDLQTCPKTDTMREVQDSRVLFVPAF